MLELCLRDDQPFYRSLLPAFHDQFSAPYFRDNLKELHETKRQKMKNNFSVSQKVNIKIYLRHIVIKYNYFTMGSSHSGKNGRLEIVKDEIPLYSD